MSGGTDEAGAQEAAKLADCARASSIQVILALLTRDLWRLAQNSDGKPITADQLIRAIAKVTGTSR